MDATRAPPPSLAAAPSFNFLHRRRAAQSLEAPLLLYCRLPCHSPCFLNSSLYPCQLFLAVNNITCDTTNISELNIPGANPSLASQPIPDPEPHTTTKSASFPQLQAAVAASPPNQATPKQTTNSHPQKWHTKAPKAHPPPTHPKPTTPAPTNNPATTAVPPLPWADPVPTALRPATRTTTAANSKVTTSRRCSTSSSPCTRSRARAILRHRGSIIRMIGDAGRVVRGFARELWVRWLVVVVWIVCSRGEEKSWLGGRL